MNFPPIIAAPATLRALCAWPLVFVRIAGMSFVRVSAKAMKHAAIGRTPAVREIS